MREPVRLLEDRVPTPVGDMILVTDVDGGLRAAFWSEGDRKLRVTLGRQCGPVGFTLERAHDPGGAASALAAYFAGELDAIDGLAVSAPGTPFQLAVWSALREIPCGTTTSYGELAHRIGLPAAVRAVGLANGSNPVGVVVPCHRVIGKDGSLTGYGGGLDRKRWLLAHEGALGGGAGPRLFDM